MKATTSRPRLLYLAPVMPSDRGNGLAMRAGLVLEALARDFDVSLLVVPISGRADAGALPTFVTGHAREVAVQPVIHDGDASAAAYRAVVRLKTHGGSDVGAADDVFERLRTLKAARAVAPAPASRGDERPSQARHATDPCVRQAAERFAGTTFDVVHVMRLYMAPFADPYLGLDENTRPVCVLDLDDDESTKFRRFSVLHALDGAPALAEATRLESDRFLAMEREYLPRFDAVLVCSERDAIELRSRHGLSNLAVLPNAIRVIDHGPQPNRDDRSWHCLFVGSLGYHPNIDAARFFCREILPRLRQRGPHQATVAFVGKDAPADLVRDISAVAGATFVGEVPDVAPFYRAATIAVVPLRAAGGTRIKILEAFMLGTPVVSTPMGAEGLEVIDGAHLLLAESATDFADACSRLLNDEALQGTLAKTAGELVRTKYAMPIVTERARRSYRAIYEKPRRSGT